MIVNLAILMPLYLKKRTRQYLPLVLQSWALLFYLLTGVFQYLLLSPLLFKIQVVFILISCLFTLIALDHMSRYSVDPKKIFLLGIITCGLIISLFDTDIIILTTLITGEPTLKATGSLKTWGLLLTIGLLLPYFVYTLRIYLRSPKSIKPKAVITLIGGICYGLLPFVFYGLSLTDIILGIMGFTTAIGSFLVTLSFKKEPRLINVLIEFSNKAKFKMIDKILTMCSHCNKVKNVDNQWVTIEEFFFKNSNVQFSHGICDQCMITEYSG